MYTDLVLLESRSARSGMAHRVEVLGKVKALRFSTGNTQATTQDVANYFEVAAKTVEKLVERHREELENNGLAVLQGADLQEFVTDRMSVTNPGTKGYPQMVRSLTVFNRRAVLNVAMLLRDSEVARWVRTALLSAEESVHPGVAMAQCAAEEFRQTLRNLSEGHSELDQRVTRVERSVHDLGTGFQELGPVIGRISARLERMDHRLVETERRTSHTERVVCAMSERLTGMSEEMRSMRGDLQSVLRATGAKPARRGRRN
ncbi:hypothetical protein [Streptomyces iconiensis]|uniref:Phage protein n=1 Tax=Streptomyces iconiensis TaxID=1384038 RepID=A0ABT7A4C0_9ACTN|nr:hypothetical protein [Streptomyces iconiensis]MDJ1136165.1 hypothetical protein [Streptomyces iconiensis]